MKRSISRWKRKKAEAGRNQGLTGVQDSQCLYNKAEMKEMETYRNNLHNSLGHDPGPEAYLEWIDKYAQNFRQTWKHSH